MPHHHLHKRQHQHAAHEHSGRDAQPRDPNHVRDQNVDTLVSVVYVTAAPTFDGPVGGYTTLGSGNGAPPAASPSSPSPLPASSSSPETFPTSQTPQSTDQAAPTTSAVPASSTTASSQSQAKPVSDAQSTSSDSSTTTPPSSTPSDPATTRDTRTVPSKTDPSSNALTSVTPTTSQPASGPTSGTSSSVPASTPAASSSGGVSGGAKAGLAIGLLALVALILGLAFFCYRRRKKQQDSSYQRAGDEKNPFGDAAATALARHGSVRSTRTTAEPPQLSLRPVTQFRPDLPGQRQSSNPAASPVVDSGNRNDGGPAINRDLEKAQMQTAQSSNPFGELAEEIPAPLRIRTPTPEGEATAARAGVVAGVVAGATVAQRHNAPKPLDIKPSRVTSPSSRSPAESAMPSPAGTEFSMNSASAASATNGPPAINVHRVQLDFKPSMEDELELRAGQLVRLLHEYDDGWALCIRLDRSQQGVAPRTCLSNRPVKPRPNGNPRAGPTSGSPVPGMRVPQQQQRNAPYTTGVAGAKSNPNLAPRPMSPSALPSQRSMSPGPYGGGPQRSGPNPVGKRRSNSASDVRERRNSPPGPSPMNPNAQLAVARPQTPTNAVARKPVPGQAI